MGAMNTKNTQSRQEMIAERRAEKLAEGRAYAARRFSIPLDEVVWYNSGICYDRVVVKTREAAEKVRAAVKGETVNGGWFHGLPLGGIDTSIDKDVTLFEVIC
jgi:hypothetical protein